ncbi:uncharacterized protein LOC132706728 [Cylas formicarius]|uniref:uncharacterized protein LOC132706728 n=1 Tax=Cylas formicarius TaxID=197179 RepID=UPI0029588B91|nr:uncharacterized protein LOC132706728 [Cylas formicarius]
MSSDTSDEENLELLREATDPQFINDCMFKDKSSDSSVITVNIREQLPSLRKNKDEDEQYNFFRVTPEFRGFVAKRLARSLDDYLESLLVDTSEVVFPRKQSKNSGIRLFTSSESFLKIKKLSKNVSVCDRKVIKRQVSLKPYNSEKVSNDVLRQLAVNPDDILSQKEVKHWSTRSKGQVFRYKQTKGGQLVQIEREFKSYHSN